MGMYINPPGDTKENFLWKNGAAIPQEEAELHDDFEDILLVVLIDNGNFTAAGICYSEAEKQAFLHPDSRPKTWWLVKKELLEPYL
jgi:hypothetical protein